MNNKSLISYLIYFFLSFEFVGANEIQFEAREILSSENGDIITGNKNKNHLWGCKFFKIL